MDCLNEILMGTEEAIEPNLEADDDAKMKPREM
jgi:hypothetical protein